MSKLNPVFFSMSNLIRNERDMQVNAITSYIMPLCAQEYKVVNDKDNRQDTILRIQTNSNTNTISH